MPITRDVGIVFRVAAGPRLGFGHLARCRAIARALGVVPRMSIRGSDATRHAARRLGVRLLPSDRVVLATADVRLVVVDDPHHDSARVWVVAARRAGVRVAVLHDAARVRHDADLVIDGSLRTRPLVGDTCRCGPRFAVVDPRIRALRARRRPRTGRVVIALGGGAHVFAATTELVQALAARMPGADLAVAPGFTRRHTPPLAAGRWMTPGALAPALASAALAIVGGGLTAYEAAALGVPAVAVAVVPAQRPSVRALVRRGAALDGGALDVGVAAAAACIADQAGRLWASPGLCRRLSLTSRRLVDGGGAARIATALRRLAREARA